MEYWKIEKDIINSTGFINIKTLYLNKNYT